MLLHWAATAAAIIVASVVWGTDGLVVALGLSGLVGMLTWSALIRQRPRARRLLWSGAEAVGALVGLQLAGWIGGLALYFVALLLSVKATWNDE
jgi:hypothetical protein